MLIYTYECHTCGVRTEHTGLASPEEEHEKTGYGDNIACKKCGETAWRVFNSNIKGGEYSKAIISDSLAMSPDQIPEHNELFPDVEVLPDGRPKFTNFKQHDAYLDKTGFYKCPKKIDGRHKERIA